MLSGTQYILLEGVLYYVTEDKTLRVVPPAEDRKQLFDERIFSGHLRDAKIHGVLASGRV